MAGNEFGHILRWKTFGESHGPAMGVVIEGCPAGLDLDFKDLEEILKKRRPGQSEVVSGRGEKDAPHILSGIFEGKSLGTPIAVVIYNRDARSEDYDKDTYRTGHADDLWQKKYGHRDHRGGGRSSGRETIGRVIAGWVAQSFCLSQYPKILNYAYTESIGHLDSPAYSCLMEAPRGVDDLKLIEKRDLSPVRCPDFEVSEQMLGLLKEAKEAGKSYGGCAQLVIKNIPAGLGQPVFSKLKSELASAIFGIGATTALELGDGLRASTAEGSEFHGDKNSQSRYGGIRGGISTGEPIFLKTFFKPTSSVMDIAKKGRHDPCIVPRAIPVIEAMVWTVLADQILLQRLDQV